MANNSAKYGNRVFKKTKFGVVEFSATAKTSLQCVEGTTVENIYEFNVNGKCVEAILQTSQKKGVVNSTWIFNGERIKSEKMVAEKIIESNGQRDCIEFVAG